MSKMNRKAIIISEDELKNKLKDYICNFDKDESEWKLNIYSLREDYTKLDKDLNKILFDTENIEIYVHEGIKDYEDILGFHTLSNGLSFLGVIAGGDWEVPVFFIIYFDGKTLRGYIPEKGNVFNKLFKSAYGSEGEKVGFTRDKFNSHEKKLYKEIFKSIINEKELNKVLDLDIDDAVLEIFNWACDLTYDKDLLFEDETDAFPRL